MKIREEHLHRLAEKVYNDLAAEGLITPRRERGAVVGGIAAALGGEFAKEQSLERDAVKLLDETLAGMGRAAMEIDRHKMLKMIKAKLARERKVVL